MDNKVILNPFKDYHDVTSIASSLAVFIKSEAEFAQRNINHFNEHGGDNAQGQDWWTAQAFKNEAEKSLYTLRTLERFAKYFADMLTPEARAEIRNILDFIDCDNNSNRKAG